MGAAVVGGSVTIVESIVGTFEFVGFAVGLAMATYVIRSSFLSLGANLDQSTRLFVDTSLPDTPRKSKKAVVEMIQRDCNRAIVMLMVLVVMVLS